MKNVKYSLLLLLLNLLAVNSESNAKTITVQNNVIKESKSQKGKLICTRSKIKLGKIKKGQLVKQDFVFINKSKNSVEIIKVDPSCNCTKIASDKKVGPNKKGKVSFTIDTKDKPSGKNTVSAVVKTNGETAFFYLELEFDLI